MVSAIRSAWPQFFFSVSVSSETFKGTVSMFSIGVDTNVVAPQPIKKREAERNMKDNLRYVRFINRFVKSESLWCIEYFIKGKRLVQPYAFFGLLKGAELVVGIVLKKEHPIIFH